MHVAARTYLSTGVALVGAGAIAISPVAPPLPDVKAPTLSAAGVGLSAAVNPIQTWIEVLGQAAENLSVLGQQFAERPAPILQQVFQNQLANVETLAPALESFLTGFVGSLDPTNPEGIPANLREAFETIVAGNPAEGVPAIFQAFLQPILFPSLELLVPVQGIITQSAQNVLDVANQAITVVALGAIGLLNPVFSGFSAVGAAAQAVVDAANEGDIAGVIAAVLDIPGVVAGGVLNGFGFDGGLLTPESGTFAALMTLRNMIADALKPNPPAGLLAETSSAPSEDAVTTVTFDIADGEASVTKAGLESRTPESPEPATGGDAPLADDAGEEVVDQAPEEEAPEDEAPEVEAPEVEAPEDGTADDDAAEDEAAADEAAEQEASDDEDANDTDDTGSKDTGGDTGGDDIGGAEA